MVAKLILFASLALFLGLFWLVERATRLAALRPGYYVEVPR